MTDPLTIVVLGESRALRVPFEGRVIVVPSEWRIITVPAENRVIEVGHNVDSS